MLVLKRDEILYAIKRIRRFEDSRVYYDSMEKLTIDDYVINDYHVNKHFGLGDFTENGAYVKDEIFRYFPNAKLYKERYIQDKKVKDKAVRQRKNVKKKNVRRKNVRHLMN